MIAQMKKEANKVKKNYTGMGKTLRIKLNTILSFGT